MPSLADLECTYLLGEGAIGPSLADMRRQVYGDNEHAYFAALSGLPYERSLSDHRLAVYRAAVDPDNVSLSDTARAFWEQEIAGGGVWSPTDLAGLALWLDADDASTFTFSSGAQVASWTDKKNGRIYTQATLPSQPLRNATINGRTAVKFDGADDWVQHASSTPIASQPFTVAVVYRADDTSTKGLFDNDSAQRVLANTFSAGQLMIYAGSSLVSGGANVLSQVDLAVFTYNGASSTIRQNRAQVATGNPGANSFGSSVAHTHVLARENGSKLLNGVIAEFIVVSGALGGSDLSSLETYLHDKWGTL